MKEELTSRYHYLVLGIIISASIICVISTSDHQRLAYAKDSNNDNDGENKTRTTFDSGLPLDVLDSMLSKLRTFCENSSGNLTTLNTITCNAVMNVTQGTSTHSFSLYVTFDVFMLRILWP
jgi:hypothetical protein